MSTIATPSQEPATPVMAAGMVPWLAKDWVLAITRWSPSILRAIVYRDGNQLLRMSHATREALGQQAWSVLLDLFEHMGEDHVEQLGKAGYALLRHAPEMTWERLIARRSANITPQALAKAIMFQAAAALDEPMLNAMLAHGPTLRDRDHHDDTLPLIVAVQLHASAPAQIPVALGLFLKLAQAIPRREWSSSDLRRTVMMMPSDVVLAILGERPLRDQLLELTLQAIQWDRPKLIKTWLPQVIARAQAEKGKPSTTKEATEFLRDAVLVAVEASTSLTTTRGLMDQLAPWSSRTRLENAFHRAARARKWDKMDALWASVRPEQALKTLMDRLSIYRDVEDWVLSRCPPKVRASHLVQAGTALTELPLTQARMVAEQREVQAADCRPARASRRQRA